MDGLRVKNGWRRLCNFLFSHKSRELLVFLFFLAVSAGFWLSQTLDETYETEVRVPLLLTDIPEEVVITTPLPAQLTVGVRDRGTMLARYWQNEIDTLRLSFSDYDNGQVNGRVHIPQADVLKQLRSRLLGTTKVLTVRPDTLEYYYNHGLHATVPVVLTGEVEPNSHFYLRDVQISPSEVDVFASAAVLDTLTAARTVPLALTDLQESTTVSVELRPIRGAKIEPESVELSAVVDVYMENTIEVPVVSLNFPGNKQLRTFPSTVQVTYTIGYSRSHEVTRKNFVSVITYEEILELQKQGATKIPVRLKSIPEGVTNVRIAPSEVDYLVETVSEVE